MDWWIDLAFFRIFTHFLRESIWELTSENCLRIQRCDRFNLGHTFPRQSTEHFGEFHIFLSVCTLDGLFFQCRKILVPRVRRGGTRRWTGNELSSASFVSGASSRFEFDVVGLASLSTESHKSGEALSLESGQVVHCVCDHGHTVDGNARRALRVSHSRAVAAGRSHPSRRPHISQKCALSVVPNKLPLPTSWVTGPFVFGNSSPLCTCKPGYSNGSTTSGGVPAAQFNDRVGDFPGCATDTTTRDAVESKH